MGKPSKKRSRDKRTSPAGATAAAAELAPARRQRWTIPLGLALVAAGLFFMARRESPDVLYRKARKQLAKNRSEAIETLELSIARGGGDAPASQVLRCRLFGAAGRWVEAAGYFTTIPHPERAPIEELTSLAHEARAAGELVLCRLALQKGAELPRDGQAAILEQLALLEQSTGRFEEARDAVRRLRAIDHGNTVASLIMGRILREERTPGPAAVEFRQALAGCSEPERCGEARRGLVSVLLSMGEIEEARAVWDSGEQTASPGDDDLVLKATLLRLERNPQKAIEALEALAPAARRQKAVLFLEGECRLDLGQNQEGARVLESVVELDPFHKEAHHKLGLALQRLGDVEKARRHFERSRELTTKTLRILELEGAAPGVGDEKRLSELADLYDATGDRLRAESLRKRLSGN